MDAFGISENRSFRPGTLIACELCKDQSWKLVSFMLEDFK